MSPRTLSFSENDESSLDRHYPPSYSLLDQQSEHNAPPPPEHRQLPPINTRQKTRDDALGHQDSNRTVSTTTPGADYLGEAAVGGGISGLAFGISNQYQRESGLEAIREADRIQQTSRYLSERATFGTDTPYVPQPPSTSRPTSLNARLPKTSYESPRMSQGHDPFHSPAPSRLSNPFDDNRGSPLPSPGRLTPRGYPSTTSIPMNDYPPPDAFANGRGYSDNPYNHYSSAWDPRVSRADIDPNEIDDDGDDLMAPPPSNRRSMLAFDQHSHSSLPRGAAAASDGAAAGGVLGTLGGLVGRKVAPSGTARDTSGYYGPVGGQSEAGAEKSEWLHSETSGRKRLRWIVGIIVALIIIGGIVGGAIAGIKRSKSQSSGSSAPSAKEDDGNGDLDKDSAEIKKLLNNPNLHKVLPGIDYTPFNAQYPDCLSNPPSQNNVTRDLAVLSQLTNTLRLYGTDCNQTEMVLHATERLGLSGFKVWLGVWLDGNSTTVDRGIDAMHDILSKHGAAPFAGVVVGNEVLFRKEVTEDKLGQILDDTKKYLSDNKLDLPVATSDLGDAWTTALAAKVDVLMANVHPFFAGVTADKAAGWTYTFWTGKNVPLTQGTNTKNFVSEVGWPSAGGTHCSPDQQTCIEGSKAGIEEMNQFMDSYICQSLSNGTEFFW